MNVQSSHTFIDATITTDTLAAIKAANHWQEAAKPLIREYSALDDSLYRLERAYWIAKEAHNTNAYPELLCAKTAIESAIGTIHDHITAIRDSYMRDQLPGFIDATPEEDERWCDLSDILETEVATVQDAIKATDEQLLLEFGSAVRL